MQRLFFLAIFSGFLMPALSSAAMVTTNFYGMVTSSVIKPWGFTVALNGPVTGQFTYDTTSLATQVVPNGFAYDQHIAGGFTATIGGVTVRADEYLVQVANDIVSGANTTDQIKIVFTSGNTPPLTTPLSVNGVDETVGMFSILLSGPSTLWSDASLPSSVNILSFNNRLGVLSDKPTGVIDVAFSVTPEPASIVSALILVTMLGFGTVYRRIRTRQ